MLIYDFCREIPHGDRDDGFVFGVRQLKLNHGIAFEFIREPGQ